MRLNVIEAGPSDGDGSIKAPVVLIHGLFGQGRNLGRMQRELASDGRRVVVFDLRSHGSSPHGPLHVKAMAADIDETMEQIGLRSAVFMGHSLGGKTAMATALLFPQRVRRLMVADIAPASHHHPHNMDYTLAMRDMELRPGMTRAEAHAALEARIPDRSVRDLLLQNLTLGAAPAWKLGLDDIIESLPAAEGWPDFPPGTAYTGRTLFLRAEHSDYVTPEHEAAIRRFFPRATVATLRDTGHWLHADRPEEFTRILADFVAGEDMASHAA